MLHFIAKLIVRYHGIPGVRYTVENEGEDFTKPAVIICNHQSHLDLMVMLSQTRNLVILTNDWVWNSPFFGIVLRNAEYYPVSMGIDTILPKLQSLVERGYSIVVYPEGTRSKDCSIGRFYKGAFHIARFLELDILPMIEYGMGHVLPKTANSLRKGQMLMSIRKRVEFDQYDKMGTTKQITSWFRKYYIAEYERMCNRLDQFR
jgi:1-acyl-sn-glycerol-3-phosphate acyltransferase